MYTHLDLHLGDISICHMCNVIKFDVTRWRRQVALTFVCLRHDRPDVIVSCALNAGGTRVYKIAGRNRTAKEIKVTPFRTVFERSLRTRMPGYLQALDALDRWCHSL